MKDLCWLLLVGTALTGCSSAPETAQEPAGGDRIARPEQPDRVESNFDQELMERAIAKARATQGEFVAALLSQRPGTSHYAIKKAFNGEHIWLSDVEWNGTSFFGAVSNPPENAIGIQLGDRVEARPEELSDWMYVEDDVLRGGYTTRVLHYESTPAVQQETLRRQSFTIPPIDF